MTREEFIKKAVRDMEKKLGIPEGWWGDGWQHVWGPYDEYVRFNKDHWLVDSGGTRTRHDNRGAAINAAKKRSRR